MGSKLKARYNRFQIVSRLVFTGNNWLLKMAFFFLPISLIVVLATLLFIDNTILSYQRYLKKCYLGYQGRILIESTSPEHITALKIWSKKKGYAYSEQYSLKTELNFVLNNGQIIHRNLKIIVLEENYFQKSFLRNNLTYIVFKEEDKLNRLLRILHKIKGTAIVYARNRRKTKEIANSYEKTISLLIFIMQV